MALFAVVIIAVVVAAAAGFAYYQFFFVQEADLPLALVGTKQETTATKTAVVRIVEGASLESNPEFMVPEVATVFIGINNTVQWTNEDTVPHTVASDDGYQNAKGEALDSRVRSEAEGGAFIMPGESFEFTFTESGTFEYHHEPHPWVQGTIIVLDNNEQSPQRFVIEPKSYSRQSWASSGSGESNGKFFSFNSTLSLRLCDALESDNQDLDPGASQDNPITLSRSAGQEKAVRFCATSSDKEAITWELRPRDMPSVFTEEKGALEEGVMVAFDKETISFPPYVWNAASSTPAPPLTSEFTVYLSANSDTSLGGSELWVLAIRHLDSDSHVQVISYGIAIRVLE